MRARSVSRVPLSRGSITWSKVTRIPTVRDSSTQRLGGSTRVIKVLLGKPLALLVMAPPG
jgi:hypothetical protein